MAAQATARPAMAQSAAASAASQPAAIVESCPVDPKQTMDLAARRGYSFAATTAGGSAVCSLHETDPIMIVSATASADALCDFELFMPPPQGRLAIIRAAIKSGPGGNTKYIHRGNEFGNGLKVRLDAKRGETRQFRIIGIDIEPKNNQCLDATF